MKQVITAFACLLLVPACAGTHQPIQSQATHSNRLNTSNSIYISMPQDGIYGLDTYRGSGQITAQIVKAAFERHARAVKYGGAAQPLDQALEAARKARCKYLVYPTILHWEDRATAWSGIPDRVEIKIDIVDVATGETSTSTIIKGKTGVANFDSDHPQDLLPQPIEDFVLSLY